MNGELQVQGRHLHGRSLQVPTPARGPVGIAVHCLDALLRQRPQGWNRRPRGAEEGDPGHPRACFRYFFCRNCRLTGPKYSTKSLPRRWSISWQKARASRSSPTSSCQLPSLPRLRMVTFWGRSRISRMPGMDRQPSLPTWTPSSRVISGLMSTICWARSSPQEQSITARLRFTPTWAAARPTPSSAREVSKRAATSCSSSGVQSPTSRLFLFRRGSPQVCTDNTAIQPLQHSSVIDSLGACPTTPRIRDDGQPRDPARRHAMGDAVHRSSGPTLLGVGLAPSRRAGAAAVAWRRQVPLAWNQHACGHLPCPARPTLPARNLRAVRQAPIGVIWEVRTLEPRMLRSFRQVFKSNRTPMAAVMIVVLLGLVAYLAPSGRVDTPDTVVARVYGREILLRDMAEHMQELYQRYGKQASPEALKPFIQSQACLLYTSPSP